MTKWIVYQHGLSHSHFHAYHINIRTSQSTCKSSWLVPTQTMQIYQLLISSPLWNKQTHNSKLQTSYAWRLRNCSTTPSENCSCTQACPSDTWQPFPYHFACLKPCLYGGFLNWWYPTTIGFPPKNYLIFGWRLGVPPFKETPISFLITKAPQPTHFGTNQPTNSSLRHPTIQVTSTMREVQLCRLFWCHWWPLKAGFFVGKTTWYQGGIMYIAVMTWLHTRNTLIFCLTDQLCKMMDHWRVNWIWWIP